ncbi:MAG: hypothetical protein JWQ87_5468 [Candidatus Sulfotelmatobacter sp.]|nr:hypothetical protein [Candidatus Sulfotelmatobacter sp.]
MGDGKNKENNKVPQPPSPSTVNPKIAPFAPYTIATRGDIVIGDGFGWWVSTRTHVTGPVFTLRPGESTDTWRWSVGPS